MAMFRTYTETYDMNTEQDCPTVLGIHTPIGKTPYLFLGPAFRMYRKFKYIGADITIVNAARLPVDPEQLGKIEGTNYVDPRDTLNPVLFRGCHGESMGKILDSMYSGLLASTGEFKGDSVDKKVFTSALQNFYYTALGDDSWRKSPIQKTLHIKNLHPLVYQVALPHQLLPTNGLDMSKYRTNNPAPVVGDPVGTGNAEGAENGQDQPSVGNGWATHIEGPTHVRNPADGTYQYLTGLNPMFTNKMSRLGWMDTLQFIGQNVDPSDPAGFRREMVAQLPKLMMGILMLPAANLCRQYLRVIIRHKFKFAGFRTITTAGIDQSEITDFLYGYHNEYTGNTSKSVYDPGVLQDNAAAPFDPNEPVEDDEIDR